MCSIRGRNSLASHSPSRKSHVLIPGVARGCTRRFLDLAVRSLLSSFWRPVWKALAPVRAYSEPLMDEPRPTEVKVPWDGVEGAFVVRPQFGEVVPHQPKVMAGKLPMDSFIASSVFMSVR